MKYAYIALDEPVLRYDGMVLGARVVQLDTEKIHEENYQYIYKECSEDIILHKVYYDVNLQLILDRPNPPLPIINTGTSTTVSVS